MGLNYDFVKVLDFGLVKTQQVGGELNQDLTLEGVTSGTPAYMAPEIVLGKGQVDARADLYALGGVAYWLLTGQLVFEQDTPMAMVIDHVRAEPVPPSQRTELEIPEALDRIILKCLEKDPARRYQSAMELEGELRLEEFLSKYPSSRFRKEVVDTLDKVRFRRVEMDGSIDAYRQFQRRYPTSQFGGEARRQEELLAFHRAWGDRTEEAFRYFLKQFPRSSHLSSMGEVRGYLRALDIARVFAYEDFLAVYPRSRLADDFVPLIDEFEIWAEKLEFGKDPIEAIRHFGQLGDETAVPLLVGKLTVPALEAEARKAIFLIGEPALSTLMEVLISPMQSLELKDRAALIIGELGDMTTIPAMRTYVTQEDTAAGREALLMLEQKVGR